MPAKRLLYFTSNQVSAYTWSAARLVQDATFENAEATPPEFEEYIDEAPEAIYFLVVDIVEEDFHQETIPYVRGGAWRSRRSHPVSWNWTCSHWRSSRRWRCPSLPGTWSSWMAASSCARVRVRPAIAALACNPGKQGSARGRCVLAALAGASIGEATGIFTKTVSAGQSAECGNPAKFRRQRSYTLFPTGPN